MQLLNIIEGCPLSLYLLFSNQPCVKRATSFSANIVFGLKVVSNYVDQVSVLCIKTALQIISSSCPSLADQINGAQLAMVYHAEERIRNCLGFSDSPVTSRDLQLGVSNLPNLSVIYGYISSGTCCLGLHSQHDFSHLSCLNKTSAYHESTVRNWQNLYIGSTESLKMVFQVFGELIDKQAFSLFHIITCPVVDMFYEVVQRSCYRFGDKGGSSTLP